MEDPFHVQVGASISLPLSILRFLASKMGLVPALALVGEDLNLLVPHTRQEWDIIHPATIEDNLPHLNHAIT